MQFKGSLRSPGDRDSGIRVVLVVDEYHLEIRRDAELIGRWYLADVEVARDIAERFVLFLGDDEVEFLADDALHFAYDGVTAMQEGWLKGQKNKRRNRKAAEQAARKKDEFPITKPPVTKLPAVAASAPGLLSESDSIRARRRATEVGKRAAAASTTPDPVGQLAAPSLPPTVPPTEPATESWPPPPAGGLGESAGPARSPAKNGQGDGTTLAARRRAVAEASSAPPVPAPAARMRRLKSVAEPEPAELPAPATADSAQASPVERPARRGRRVERPRQPIEREAPSVREPERAAEEPGAVELSAPEEVRFAPEGHHPAETSTGLLSKLRRQPKPPTDHVHKFKESGSSVGLVRRVCIECSYVSIGIDD